MKTFDSGSRRRTPRLIACLSIVLTCLGMVVAPTAEANTMPLQSLDLQYLFGIPTPSGGSWWPESPQAMQVTAYDATTVHTVKVPTVNDVIATPHNATENLWAVWPNSGTMGFAPDIGWSGNADYLYVGYEIYENVNTENGSNFTSKVLTKSPETGKIISPGKVFHTPVHQLGSCTAPNAKDCHGMIATMMLPSYVRAIRFNANGGTGSFNSQDYPSMQNGDPSYDWLYTMRKSPYTRNGYTFVGWNTAANGSGTWYQPGDSVNMGKPQAIFPYYRDKITSLRLYAQWSQNPIRITYDGNGSTGGTTPEPHTVKPNANVTIRKNTFTRTGYRFIGWNTAKDGSGTTIEPDSVRSFSKDTVLYAQWRSDPVLTYNTNKPSTYTNVMPSAPASVSVPYNTAAADNSGWKSGDTTKLKPGGYKFLGWYTGPQDNAGLYDWSKPLTGNVTVYAHWQRLQANVVYDANGGTGSHANTTGWQYSDVTVPSDTSKSFKRDGYVFLGWDTQADGNGTAYKDGSQVPLQDKDITLYVQWQPVFEQFTPTGGVSLPLLVAGGVTLLVMGIGSTVMLTRRMRGEQ